MKYVIVYWSRYGNGKKVVEHLSRILEEKGNETTILTTDQANPTSMPESDMYVFSAPTEMMNVQKNMRKFMKKLCDLEDCSYGIINTHETEGINWLSKMEKMLSKKGMKMKAGMDFQIGKGAKKAEGLPEGWEKEVEQFAEKLSGS
jgi:flavodoxin